MSSRSLKDFKQGCKDCGLYYFPAYMWQNDFDNYKRKDKALVDNLKNHRSDLCEACKKGRCTVNRKEDYTFSSGRNYKGKDYGFGWLFGLSKALLRLRFISITFVVSYSWLRYHRCSYSLSSSSRIFIFL